MTYWEKIEEFGKSFFDIYMTMLGQFEPDDAEKIEEKIFLTVAASMLVIVLLNLIVALMSDAYARVMTDSK